VNNEHPDPTAQPQKRRFSNEYKLKVLTEYEAQPDSGARGSLLRREGLYTSHIVDWRKARDAGKLHGQASCGSTASLKELERLRKRNQRLEEQVTKYKLALDIQGKASELLERLLAESDEQTRQQP
jgi:transposase